MRTFSFSLKDIWFFAQYAFFFAIWSSLVTVMFAFVAVNLVCSFAALFTGKGIRCIDEILEEIQDNHKK